MSGSGTIKVLPDVLSAAAREIIYVAGDVSSLRGSFGGAGSAAAACAPEGAGAFQEMQGTLAAGLAALHESTDALGHKTGAASADYVATDASAIPLTGRGGAA